MNQDLQNLEIKVENDGTTPQGRLTATEWNILVAAVKSLDLTGGSADAASILQVVANAGYATQEWVTSQKYITSSAFDNLAKNLVTLDTTQAITGMKDFTNGLKIGGLPVYKLKDSTIFIDANLVVTGAFTMHGSGSTTFPTIWANIPFDSTMRWDGSRWSVASGGSSSGSGGGISIADVENYLTTNGYATQSWVTGKGYITASALEPYALKTAIPTKLSQLTDDVVSGKYLPLTGGTVNGQVTSEGVDNFVAKGSTYSLYFGIGAGQVNRGIYDLTQNKWWIVRGIDATTTINASIIAEGLRINQSAFDNGLVLNRTVANSGVGIVAMSNDVRLGSFGINGTKTFEISGDNGIVAQVSTVTGEATFNGMTTIKHGGNTPLVINQTYATNNSRGVVLMNGSMANGHMYYSHLFGKAASSKNSAYVGFYNAGAGSDSNYLSMGLYGVNNVLNITAAGNVGVGTTSPSQKLHVVGNLLMAGAITMNYSSDERLKKNIHKVNASEVLMSLGGVWQYEYIDSEVQKNSTYGGSHFGLIYQNVKGTALNKMCYEREDGFGTLNYLDTNFISLIAGATMENISEVEKLKRKIRTLENKVKQLEGRA